MENILDRFLRYVRIDTRSDESSDTQPSTAKQMDLLRLLEQELRQMGLDASLDRYGYVMARIPSNLAPEQDAPVATVGFIAHVDTSPDVSGAGVQPRIIRNYDGGDIKLKGAVIRTSESPELSDHVGETIITSDGTTLLGADDKSGVAEIMDAVQYITGHPEFRHGEVRIAFTPDEEIGRGVVKFDVARFGADFAYTIDGGEVGELEYENFNAAAATVTINGRNVHPGYAKGRMINAQSLAGEFDALLPQDERPETTEGRQGFFHRTETVGSVERCTVKYIIRDHDSGRFGDRKRKMEQCAAVLNGKYGEGTVTVGIRDQYYNMKEMIEPHRHIITLAEDAMRLAGVTPRVKPIRGGTDGANLSFRGLPCPNIFAGGNNFHSRLEWVSLESMQKAARVILNIISGNCYIRSDRTALARQNLCTGKY